MKKEKLDIRKELKEFRFQFDLLQKIPCTKQENKEYRQLLKNGESLPEGVFAYEYEFEDPFVTEFYTVYEPELTEAEIREYLTYQKLSMIKTIQNCVLFLTVLTVISLIVSFFWG